LDREDNKCRVFVKITLGNCPLGRLRRKWEGNIKMNVREVCNKDEILIRQSPFRALVLVVLYLLAVLPQD
jgi:hypothetical protein